MIVVVVHSFIAIPCAQVEPAGADQVVVETADEMTQVVHIVEDRKETTQPGPVDTDFEDLLQPRIDIFSKWSPSCANYIRRATFLPSQGV